MEMLGTIGAAGAAALAVGGLGALRRSLVAPALLLQAGGAALIGVAGAWSLFSGTSAGGSFRNAIAPALGVDPLTGFFLLVLGVVTVPTLVWASGALPGTRGARPIGALTALFVLSLCGVLTARDVGGFLACWELMTLVPAAAILIHASDRSARRDVFAYVATTHLGGVGVWLALIALQQAGAIGNGAALAQRGTGLQAFVAIAALVGFGTKAGLMPAHAWLPRAHPIAPSHFPAIASGMMVKVALYGLIRICFEWIGAPRLWLGLLLLAVGAFSALGGSLYQLFQRDLKRLLAFGTIENVGIIVLALGTSLVFAAQGQARWAALAFAAALLHVLNHGVFKSLLFLGAGSIERATGGRDLDRLGGLLRRMPWTGAAVLVGCLSIAGLPPLNGFASEWLTLQSLIHAASAGGTGIALAALGGAAALAMTAALAAFSFVKAAGMALLGPPRRPECAAAVEQPLALRAPLVALAGACLGLGIAPGLLLPELVELAPGTERVGRTVGLSAPGTGGLHAPAVAALMLGLAVVLLLARGRRVATAAPVWTSGQRIVPELRWTSAGFTKTLRLILEAVLRPTREIVLRREGGVLVGASYTGGVPHLFDTMLATPIRHTLTAAALVARRVQSGSLRGYVATLIALVALALVLARSGALS